MYIQSKMAILSPKMERQKNEDEEEEVIPMVKLVPERIPPRKKKNKIKSTLYHK